MAELTEHVVEINGIPHTMLLSDETATALNVGPVEKKAVQRPLNKSADPASK